MNEIIFEHMKLNVKYEQMFKFHMQCLINQTNMRQAHQKKWFPGQPNVYMVSVDSIHLKRTKTCNSQMAKNHFLLVRRKTTSESFHLYDFSPVYTIYVFTVVADQYRKSCCILLTSKRFFGTMRNKSIQIVLNQHDCDWTWNMVNNCLISCQLLFLA